jgi:hypothetical protein
LWCFDPIPCHGLLLRGVSRSYSDTPHSVGLLWTSDQADVETSTWQHMTFTIDIHTPGEIRTPVPESERPQTHVLDRSATGIVTQYICIYNLYIEGWSNLLKLGYIITIVIMFMKGYECFLFLNP